MTLNGPIAATTRYFTQTTAFAANSIKFTAARLILPGTKMLLSRESNFWQYMVYVGRRAPSTVAELLVHVTETSDNSV